MKGFNVSLIRQLISITIILFGITIISLVVVLPVFLIPIYEKTVFNTLKTPLDFVDNQVESFEVLSEVAYVYVSDYHTIVVSENFNRLIDINPDELLEKIVSDYGSFSYKGDTYYYYMHEIDDVFRIAITDNSYVNQMRNDIILTILPILFTTLIMIISLIIIWSRRLVLRINYLKDKVENIDNDNYIEMYNEQLHLGDELKLLSTTIDEMHKTLKTQNNYKNKMYQNLSHEFKTPIAVVLSHIEAIEDGVLSNDEGLGIIKDQALKLESKVHSLLHLNKLVYLKEEGSYKDEEIDIENIVKSSMNKFKYKNKDIKWDIKAKGKNEITGTYDIWEAIIDNIFDNFIRYANKKIKVTINKDEITFYNDGPQIDSNIINSLFTPYKKGINGNFGLGMSIIKESLWLMSYDITVNNEIKGVSFIIKKN